MAKFNAATAVDAMEYDFTKYGGGEGVIPEPSQAQVEAFYKSLGSAKRWVDGVINDAEKAAEAEDPDAVNKFIEEMPDEEINKYKHEMAEWAADVCSNCITAEYLRTVPYRVFSAFLKYLAVELNPKAE